VVELLEAAAASWNFPVSSATRDGLLAYGRLLLAWTTRINLTGARSLEQLVAEHLPDAFALASRIGGEERIVDVGSGGGLPAIPLAVLAPQVRIVMFEPIAKKAAFLRTAVRELGLGQRLRVEARRCEHAAGEEAFDVALSRATFPPAEWLTIAQRLVRPGGRVFVLARRPIDSSPAELSTVQAIPYMGGERWLIELVRST
jgi:16S rRNA (guanine527-N7)-methyltransferase